MSCTGKQEVATRLAASASDNCHSFTASIANILRLEYPNLNKPTR